MFRENNNCLDGGPPKAVVFINEVEVLHGRRAVTFFRIFFFAMVDMASLGARAENNRPFRFSETLSTESWLRFNLEHRIRFEHLENDFRLQAVPRTSALSLRTLFAAEAHWTFVAVGAAYLARGQFALGAAGALNTNPLYGYAQLTGAI